MQLTYTVFLTIVFLIYVLFLQEVGQDDLKWAHFIQQRLKSGQATLKVFNKSRPPSTFSSLENTGSMGSMDNMDNRDNMDNMDNMDNEGSEEVGEDPSPAPGNCRCTCTCFTTM